MYIPYKVISILKRAFYILKDDTAYKSDTKHDIDKAVKYFEEEKYDVALSMFVAIAKLIDCKKFHSYGPLGAYKIRNIEAREQYNRICWYIANIYNKRGDYETVLLWAYNLAFVRYYNISQWAVLLKEEDYKKLKDLFNYCDIDTDSAAEVWNDRSTSPYDY